MQHLLRSASLNRFDELARRHGLVPEAMLERAGIPLQYLHEPDLFFPYERLIALLEASARESGFASFGAELGSLQGLEILGPLAYLVRSSPTVADALLELSRYFHVHNAGARVRVEVHGGTGVVGYELTARSNVPTGQAVELAVAIGATMMRTLLGRHWTPHECVFQHAPLGEAAAYRRYFGIGPRFNGEINGYTVDARMLALPLPGADSALNDLMRRQLEAMRQRFSDALPARVESVIRSRLPGGDVSLESVASQLATSGRSLQRRLRLEGTSFQTLLDEVRRDIAEHYLRDSALSLTQITQLLAYENLSVLTRSFRRWHATTPRAWRAAQRRSEGAAHASAGSAR